MSHLLAADIGGTKSDLALFDLRQGAAAPPLYQRRYQNSTFPRFDILLSDFLSGIPQQDSLHGCFGVAAVVHRGQARLTNREWTLDQRGLREGFGFKKLTLINDLTALCSALPLLDKSHLLPLQEGQKIDGGIQAVIAPGTGLGEGFLQVQPNCFLPQGTEGGHCDFAPLTREQSALLSFMQRDHESVSYELLCSGIGLPNIFDFLTSTDGPRDQKRCTIIANSHDRTPAIIAGTLSGSPCPLCTKTLTIFLEILGAEAGNLALKTFATGGIFLGGGILPRLVGHISFEPFLKYFNRKEKMTSLMETFPVHLILKNDAALLGTASFGHHLFHRSPTVRI